ncbi:hypothetical protein BGZ70_010500 [Mortierella alpina]|uniref:Uncharacterized protein n=1 Tax=Mortierella alpina TaxID=64518 RepID=A0A9P6IZP2_MORAP|nr:hypothetical protein BGZ70_010500 [Mortierella alpina]
MAVTGSAFLDFVIGFTVSLIASVMNAAGLNLLKLDHVRNSALSSDRQRNECGRPMWHVGLYLYIASQLAGSTIALNFLKTQWVAPLGSIALIFNFVFAKILVGTQITRQDVYGTIVVMASVVWVVIFGGMNSSGDLEEKLTLDDLKQLFARVVFIIYFSILNTIIFMFLALGMYAYWAISLDDESGQLRKNMKTKLTYLLGTNRFARASGLTLEGDEGLEAEARDQRLKKVVAMIMSACGGLLASETLLLAKSGIKLITSTVAGQNQFGDYLSYFILFVLVFTAILQVYCLNTGLKLYDSVLVVPTFYGFYTAFGLINSTIYLNQLGDYEPWVLLLVLIGIVALIYGVKMLSAPKPEQSPAEGQLSSLDNMYEDDEDEDAHEMEQRSKSAKGGTGSKDPSAKKSKLSLKKKRSSKRQSRHGQGLDEESDVPSLFSSRRGMMDGDDVSSMVSSTVGGDSRNGGSSTRGRRISFTSKSSFQSDPFRTPKDSRSINEGFIGAGIASISAGAVAVATGGHRRSMLFDEETPTHVLVDTTEDLENSGDERPTHKNGKRDVAKQEQEDRRQSMLQSSFNTLTMHEKRASVDSIKQSSRQQQQQQHPRIDTSSVARTKRESARFSPTTTAAAAGLMSPSQFRAHFTNSAMPPKPKHMQGDEDDELGPFHSSADMGGHPQSQMVKGHSVRWSTGSSKIDQVFEDLNPFKVLKSSNRDSIHGVNTTSSAASSLPSSPNQGSSRPGPHGHSRQDSFTGLPSEWEVPGRKKRHSMLFGEQGRSGSASGGLVSPSSTASSTSSSTPTTTSTGAGAAGAGATVTRANSVGKTHHATTASPFASFVAGEWTPSDESKDLEVTPSPRTSRILSSPEIQLAGFVHPAPPAAASSSSQNTTFALGAAAFASGEEASSTATTSVSEAAATSHPPHGSEPQESKYQNHYFTGTPPPANSASTVSQQL